MRLPYTIGLTILLAVSGTVWGDPPTINGPNTAPPYTIVRLSTDTDVKAGKLWKVRPADPKNKVSWGLNDTRNGAAIEFTAPPGRYTVELIVGYQKNGGFVLDGVEKTITIGKAPDDDKDDEDDVVPPPNDPLLSAVQAVYGADTSPMKKDDARKLRFVYAAVADTLDNIGTAGELFTVIRSSTDDQIQNRLGSVRELFGGELGKVLPTDPTVKLDASLKGKTATQLKRFVVILDSLE